jgi:hypothetical protein
MNRGAMKIVFLVGLALLVAFMAAAAISVNRQSAADERAAHALFDGIDAMQRRVAAETGAMNARFAQVDLERYMTPAMLASTAGVRDGRAELARYRALLAERDVLMRDEAARAHALLVALPGGETRDLALRGESSTAARNQAIRDQLSQSQAADADAMQALFDWAATHRADLEVKDGTLLVHGRQPLAELDALDARLKQTRRAVQAAVGAASAVAAESTQQLAKARRSLDP